MGSVPARKEKWIAMVYAEICIPTRIIAVHAVWSVHQGRSVRTGSVSRNVPVGRNHVTGFAQTRIPI
jgi:hypothetical protein